MKFAGLTKHSRQCVHTMRCESQGAHACIRLHCCSCVRNQGQASILLKYSANQNLSMSIAHIHVPATHCSGTCSTQVHITVHSPRYVAFTISFIFSDGLSSTDRTCSSLSDNQASTTLASIANHFLKHFQVDMALELVSSKCHCGLSLTTQHSQRPHHATCCS